MYFIYVLLLQNVSDANDMAEIRSMTGICPQHNILFEDLTCLEHLQLFAGIKGVKGDDRDKEVSGLARHASVLLTQ
jgi:ATP-binding cassette subfamily A (ABC1) protein 5